MVQQLYTLYNMLLHYKKKVHCNTKFCPTQNLLGLSQSQG